MKTIITTVGTSLFENYMREEVKEDLFKESNEPYQNIKDQYNRLKNNTFSAEEYCKVENKTDIQHIEKTINEFWLKGITKKDKKWTFEDNALNEYACAEIESILKIIHHFNFYKSHVRIILIATDTVLSKLASAIIFETLIEEFEIDAYFNENIDVIQNLRVDNINNFEIGLVNFAKRFYQIYNVLGEEIDIYYAQDFIFNITGGYKGLIPFATIFGQINGLKVCYKFEDTNELMIVPQIPLKTKEKEIFANPIFVNYFSQIQKNNNKISDFIYEFYAEKALDFVVANADKLEMTIIGKFFWERYNSTKFSFYCNDEVYDDILRFQEIKKIFEEEFHYAEQRKKHLPNPKEPNGHDKVYKKKRNIERIYYFEVGLDIYIYKVFIDHDLHERYLSSKENSLDETKKQEIMKTAKLRIVEKAI